MHTTGCTVRESQLLAVVDVLVHVVVKEPDLRGYGLAGGHNQHVHRIAASRVQTLARLLPHTQNTKIYNPTPLENFYSMYIVQSDRMSLSMPTH